MIKIVQIAVLSVSFLTLGGLTSATYAESESVPLGGRLSSSQEHWVGRYSVWRRVAAKVLKVPKDASLEEFRPKVAEYLKLSPEATWEEMLAVPKVQSHLTEKRRIKSAKIFGLPSSTSWTKIGAHVESLYQSRQKGK